MNRITVWLPPDLIEVIKRKARLQKTSLSHCAQEFIKKGLLQEPFVDERLSNSSRPTKIDQYLLKSGIESLILMRRLIPEKDRAFITQATEMAREVMKQLLSKESSEGGEVKP